MLDNRHLTGRVPYLGTHILTLPAAIRARQEGLDREKFLHHEIEQRLELGIDQLELHFGADLLYPDVMKMTVKKTSAISSRACLLPAPAISLS